MNKRLIMSTNLVGTIAVLTWLIILLSNVLRAGALLPSSEKEPISTPSPSNEANIVDGVTLIRPRSLVTTQQRSVPVSMSEDFEGAWPSSGWALEDLSSDDGGEYLWGKRDCHSHTGNFGAWAIGGGAQGSALPCSAEYSNNIFTWAVYGPFDLSTATVASLTFHVWGRTEFGGSTCPFDYFFVGSSIDAINFNGVVGCGNFTNGSEGNGYFKHTLDLGNRLGEHEVWLALVLETDHSITDIGITIDDITLDVASSTWKSYLPVLAKEPGLNDPPPVTPSSTATPTVTPTRTPTNTPSPTATPTSTPFRGYDGNWSGMTSQNLPISFTIQNYVVTPLTVQFEKTNGPFTCTYTLNHFAAIPIIGNTFQVTGQVDIIGIGSVIYTITGTFNSNTSASGNLQMTVDDILCDGDVNATWTGTKQQ